MAASQADLAIAIRAYDDASATLRSIGQETRNLGGHAQAAAPGFVALSGAVAAGTIAASAFMGAVAGLISIFKGSITAGSEFSQSMANIRATLPKQDVAEFGGQIESLALNLGKDYPLSAAEAGKAIEMLAQKGIKATDIVNGGAEAVAILSSATGGDLATSAEIAAAAMNTFGLKGSDMTKVTDVMTASVLRGGMTVNDFGLAMQAGGAAVKLAGGSVDDMSLALAAMAKAGISGSDAGTSLKTMYMDLTPHTKAATEAMKDLGLLTKDGGSAFFDAQGHVKSFAEISSILANATKDLSNEEKITALQTIFGTDAIRAAAIAADLGAGKFGDLAAAMQEQGIAADAAKEKLNSLQGDVTNLSGSWETLQIILFRRLEPAMRVVVQAANNLLGAIIPLAETVDLSGLFKEAGAALQTFGGMVQDVARYFGNLADQVESWPVVGRVLSTYFGVLDDVLTGFAHLLTGDVEGAIGALGQAFEDLIDPLSDAWQWFKDLLPVALALADQGWRLLVTVGGWLLDNILRPLVNQWLPATWQLLKDLYPAARDLALLAWQKLVDVGGWLLDNILRPLVNTWLPGLWQLLKDMYPTARDLALLGLQKIADAGSWLIANVWRPLVDDWLPKVWQFLKDMYPTAKSLAAEAWQALADVGAWLLTNVLKPFVNEWLPPVLQWFKDALPVAKDLAQQGWQIVADIGSWLLDNVIRPLVNDWLPPVLQWFRDALPAAKSLATDAWQKLSDTGVWLLDNVIRPFVNDYAGPFLQWLRDSYPAAKTLAEEGWQALNDKGKWLLDNVLQPLNDDYLQPFLQWLKDSYPAAKALADEAWQSLSDVGKWLLDNVITPMVSFTRDLWQQISDAGVWDDLKTAFQNLWDAGKILVETFWPGMKDAFADTNSNGNTAKTVIEAIVVLLKGASTFIVLVSEGFKTIAQALKTISELPNAPSWVQALIGITPGASVLNTALGAGRQNQSATGGGAGTQVPMSAGVQGAAMTTEPIDNSSRASFVRTAWPYMLQAAGGNTQLANMMLAAAISENGDVGKGGSFVGNNFFGIKGTGPAGSNSLMTWEYENGQRVNKYQNFAAYNNPVEGFGAFMQFLQNNSRYAGALGQFQQTGNAVQLFQGINQAGYATDPEWWSKVANIMQNQVLPVTSQLTQEVGQQTAAVQQAQASTTAFGGSLTNATQALNSAGQIISQEYLAALTGSRQANVELVRDQIPTINSLEQMGVITHDTADTLRGMAQDVLATGNAAAQIKPNILTGSNLVAGLGKAADDATEAYDNLDTSTSVNIIDPKVDSEPVSQLDLAAQAAKDALLATDDTPIVPVVNSDSLNIAKSAAQILSGALAAVDDTPIVPFVQDQSVLTATTHADALGTAIQASDDVGSVPVVQDQALLTATSHAGSLGSAIQASDDVASVPVVQDQSVLTATTHVQTLGGEIGNVSQPHSLVFSGNVPSAVTVSSLTGNSATLNSSSINGVGNLSLSGNVQALGSNGAIQAQKIQATQALFDPNFHFNFAEGGRPPLNTLSIVGERGPELFVPDQAGTIIPAGITAGILSGRGSRGGSVVTSAGGSTLILTVNVSGNTILGEDRRVAQELAQILQPELDRLVGATGTVNT